MDINIAAELEEAGINYEYTGNEEWVTVKCPFHPDKNPSGSLNIKLGFYKCFSCDQGADFVGYFAQALGSSRNTIQAALAKKYGTDKKILRTIEPAYVELLAMAIWKAKPLLEQLKIRGVTEDTVRKYKLGEEKGRITIPIFTGKSVEDATYVNLLRYLPGALQRKFLNAPGRGKDVVLYPADQLQYNKLLLCGGPVKALAAAQQLNPHGIGAIASSNGEQFTSWPEDIAKQLSGKQWIGVCLDIDTAGVLSANRLAAELHPFVEDITLIELPLDPKKYPKGDISDFIGKENGNLYDLIQTCVPWNPKESHKSLEDEKPVSVSLQDAGTAALANRRLRFKGLVSGIEPESYYLPRRVRAMCDKKSKVCSFCPIYTQPSNSSHTLHPEHESLLSMIGAKDAGTRDAVKASLGIPPCKRVKFEIESHYHVRHFVITRDLDNTTTDEVTLFGAAVDCDFDINETYKFTGRIVPHPNNQRATALISKGSTVADTLSQFQLDAEKLAVFQPSEWTLDGVTEKFNSIYKEFESSVTRIHERRNLHTICDLAWHSVLLLKLGQRVVKGWVEVCVIGDSSQGKTETFVNLQRHYGLGTKVDCKNATVAGLLGGVQQINGRFFVSWGIIPLNDRRLVGLEELKGANPEVIAKLTEMRSSGIAEIPKIEHKKAHARTRLIALSNVRSGNDVASYAYGTQAITELIPNPEDVRRFDAFCILSKLEVDESVGMHNYAQGLDAAELVYGAELCNHLILWGWSRNENQTEFEDWRYLLSRASAMCQDFTDAVPIVDKGSMRYKLARLAAAAAVRTGSHKENDPETVYVRNCHVDFIERFLREEYTRDYFGYNRLTRAIKEQQQLKQPEALVKLIKQQAYPVDFVECMLRTVNIEPRDICDWCGADRADAGEIIGTFVRSNAFIRQGAFYRKSTEFTAILRDLNADPKFRDSKPEYIKGSM